jgi:hypothetical protein
MLSVQGIHDHLAKYTIIPESWRRKNYAYVFVECINSVVEKQFLNELHRSRFQTLIVDESTAFQGHNSFKIKIQIIVKHLYDIH